ncbi:hypothetical protein [Streptomyces sp. NPDC055912]
MRIAGQVCPGARLRGTLSDASIIVPSAMAIERFRNSAISAYTS